MAENSDDIKNLFLNLGLNPSDYHEIRSAPNANVTVSEAPRRWSLLQSAAVPKPLTAPAASPRPAPVAAAPLPPMPVAAPVPAPAAAVPRAEAAFAASLFSDALRGAALDIARAEATGTPVDFMREPELPAADRAPAPAAAPSLPNALVDAFAPPRPNDGLQSLFQSVKEPQTAMRLPGADSSRPTERRTDQIYGGSPAASSLADRLAAVPEAMLLPTPPRLVDHSDEPETRHAPAQPSRLGPVPAPSSALLSGSAPATPEGRLRFASPTPPAASAYGESLQDVFRRLSRNNRG